VRGAEGTGTIKCSVAWLGL